MKTPEEFYSFVDKILISENISELENSINVLNIESYETERCWQGGGGSHHYLDWIDKSVDQIKDRIKLLRGV